MGCGCGRSQVTSPMHTTASFARIAPSDEVYEVTFPDSSTKDFDSEAEAYQAIRLTGGGVKRKART